MSYRSREASLMSPSPHPMPATDHLLSLLEDYHSFNPSQPSVLPWPTPLQFSKQVSKGLPCVYSPWSTNFALHNHTGSTPTSASTSNFSRRYGSMTSFSEERDLSAGSIGQFKSAMSWTRETLTESVREKIEVALTPNGRADSLCFDAGEKVFLQPANLFMTIEELLQKLCPASRQHHSHLQPVCYLQSQNSNLTTTPLASLLDDLPSNIPFAKEVLGEPEAVNIWIGNAQSVTSAHRDPYENVYVVLKGEKTFTLWAPVEELTLSGEYQHNSDKADRHIASW